MWRLSAIAVCLAAMMAHSSIAAPAEGYVKLPEGRLLLVAGNNGGAVLIGQDTMVWEGRSAVVLVYRILRPHMDLGNGKLIAEETEVQRFNCDAQTYQSLGASAYDPAGEEVVWTPEEPVKPVKERTMTSRVASVVCGQIKLPAGNIVKDRATAKAMALQALPTLP